LDNGDLIVVIRSSGEGWVRRKRRGRRLCRKKERKRRKNEGRKRGREKGSQVTKTKKKGIEKTKRMKRIGASQLVGRSPSYIDHHQNQLLSLRLSHPLPFPSPSL
jgi:hypothetical protein